MRFKHTHRPGFWIGFIDFFTAGIFLLFYMPLGGLQDEIDEILGHKTMKYWRTYLLGIPQDVSKIMATWAAGVTAFNSAVGTIVVVVVYSALRPVLKKSGQFFHL